MATVAEFLRTASTSYAMQPSFESDLEVVPEIDGANFLIGEYICRTAFGNQFAVAQDIRAIADAQGFANIVISDEYANIALLQVFDDALDIENGYGVDTGKGFVQQDEAGISG